MHCGLWPDYFQSCFLSKCLSMSVLVQRSILWVLHERCCNDQKDLMSEWSVIAILIGAFLCLPDSLPDIGEQFMFQCLYIHLYEKLGVLQVHELAEKEPENGVFRMLRSDVTRFLTTILIGTTYYIHSNTHFFLM